MSRFIVTALVNKRCATGENPYWNPSDNAVYWTDIPNGVLFRYDVAAGSHSTIYEDEPVGGFTRQSDDTWLLFRVHDIAVLPDTGDAAAAAITAAITAAVPLLPFVDDTAQRFNDGIADPEGRVFAGTIGTSRQSGGLYRVETSGAIIKIWDRTGVANGMGFSPDLRHFYWTCSTTKRIFRFDYHRQSGELTNRTVFYTAPPNEGTPDGLVVDTDGNVWSARNRGSCILKHSGENGRVFDRIDLPVSKITSLAFGGPVLNTLYVTTGGGSSSPETDADGTLYAAGGVEARGQPEFLSRIYPNARSQSD